jgi:DNA-binding LytR/AlgR family response regulator
MATMPRSLSALLVHDEARVVAGRPDSLPPPAPVPDDVLPDELIPVELGGITRIVRRSHVLFVEAQGDYARLHTATGSHLIRVPLSTLQDRWAAAGFLRIHRSILVAMPHVDEVRVEAGRMRVRLGTRTLQVSRRHGRELRALLMQRRKA